MREFVEIVITPTPEQYRELASDLRLLRDHSEESNTVAILAAVRDRADRVRASRRRLLRAA